MCRFCLGDNAFAEGIGERLTPIALPPAWYVVLIPPVAVSTARVFAHPELKRDSKMITIQSFSVGQAANDLEPLVCREYPEVARYLAWLGQFGRAMMTGSGACVFAAFPDEAAARGVLSGLPAGMRGFVARGLSRHPLHELAR
jgi:4-diphosphocytidyl-2-C-methyl-D-erythritol kinase